MSACWASASFHSYFLAPSHIIFALMDVFWPIYEHIPQHEAAENIGYLYKEPKSQIQNIIIVII